MCCFNLCVVSIIAFSAFADVDINTWWDSGWRMRTTVEKPVPSRNGAKRVVEAVIDFPLLLKNAGIEGDFNPDSIRVIEKTDTGLLREVPYAYRKDLKENYITWFSQSESCDIYFDTKDRNIEAPDYEIESVPPPNLIMDPDFRKESGGAPSPLVKTDNHSLKIVVDENTPKDANRTVTLSQKVDVSEFVGQEMVFECDLIAERAAYGAPVNIELQQFRADGSRIPECVVQPRWLSIELAQGQLVQFNERGRLNPEAATVNVQVRVRCTVHDADTREAVKGPESYFTVRLGRFTLRPGERWPLPALTNAGFVDGALEDAPLNRGFEFTGQRRLVFNGASEGTLTMGRHDDPKSVHWGLEAGTLEFWCRPLWNSDDGVEHILFRGEAYGHRLQSRLRKLNSAGGNQLEFTIADADKKLRTVSGDVALKVDTWHHIAATWDFPKAQLQLFVDGKKIAEEGPGSEPWPSSLVADGGEKKSKGIGIMEDDTRSLPMQSFIGGDESWDSDHCANAAMDEFRVSDVSRYNDNFAPSRREFQVDKHTRALFHLDNERHGIHDSDDKFVRGHLSCELPNQLEEAPLDVYENDKIERKMVLVKPHASKEVFEANRGESRMTVSRPFRELPDPRFVEYRERQMGHTVNSMDDSLEIHVEGDYAPLMRSVTFDQADENSSETTLLPRWRANDNVVPLSVEDINKTLGRRGDNDAEKAFQTFKYVLETTNYYDAHYCETFPRRHRPRVSYTLLKALNIYPFDQCGPMNHMLRKLFLAVGISSTNASGTHHQFEQAFYDGGWRLFDLSSRIYWLNRDNATVISRGEMEDDPYLKLRQGGHANAWLRGRRTRATFGSAERPHNMDFSLQPDEYVSFCWHNEGRWFEVTGDRKSALLAKIPPCFGNGAIVYNPGENSITESMTYRVHCPYIISDVQVTGSYKSQKPDSIKLSLSFDEGENWTKVWSNEGDNGHIKANLLEQVTARYAYWMKLDFEPDSKSEVNDLVVRTTIVASPLALPGKLSLGQNHVTFVGGPVSVPVKTTARWVERHKSDIGVSLNAISYYMNGDEAHRNLFVAKPGSELPVSVTLLGQEFEGDISVEGLPDGWTANSVKKTDKTSDFVLIPEGAESAEIQSFRIALKDDQHDRYVPAQILVAEAPMASEAENADEIAGDATKTDLSEASGGKVVSFTGDGKLGFDLTNDQDGKYALWLRARWNPGSSTSMNLEIDDEEGRKIRASAMIGFTDWTNPRQAHTKMFAHFGEQYSHWSWYRIPDIELQAGEHRLTLGGKAGAQFDALILLPQNPEMDRAAMNLFQNWNYAPWDNPI